jgi:hypothetical protein
MFRKDDKWYSEFPPVLGQEQEVVPNAGILAVAAYDTLTGGHAAFYLEFIGDKGVACMRKLDMTAGVRGSERMETTGSGSIGSFSPRTGTNEIYINFEAREVNQDTRDRGANMVYRSFVVTDAEIEAVLREAEKFEKDVAKGKYVYRLAGGQLGNWMAKPGKDGVNCADFCIKILNGAGIADLGSKFFNTPRRVAGG